MFAALPIVLLLAQQIPAAPEEVQRPVNSVGFAAGIGYRLGAAASDVPPNMGVALTTLIQHRYATVGRGLDLGVTASFAYERYARDVRVSTMVAPGERVNIDGVRALTIFDFAALQTAGLSLGRVRPWLGVGGGISLQHFRSPEEAYKPGEARETLAVLLGAAGADVDFAPSSDIGLRLEYAHALPRPTFTTEAGRAVNVFGSRVTLRLAVSYRF